ncbi:coiled-coil domain-containing protein 57-like [Morone saxatilis]|uniref:coiled-coil domain-containing protein 57-like n=1 Tax=Morone saxatilis TaxID=34816 RepID=UPI0015E1F22F|nr:coiled-coil domain-containing protein 57-like [Morone saxatilis]
MVRNPPGSGLRKQSCVGFYTSAFPSLTCFLSIRKKLIHLQMEVDTGSWIRRDGYQKLSEDFQFNLAILDERDRELERYDVITARAVNAECHRQEELNQLHMQVAKLEEQRAKETEERQEEQCKSQHSAAQHRLQLDQLKCSMAGEIQRQTEEYERMKWDLQHKIQELEGELTLQRQEMTAAFDREFRQQEHKFNLKMDEMRAVVLSHDLKVKQLSKETEVHYQAQLQATEALKVSKEFCQQIETQLQRKEQEIKDLTADKDCRMKELEDELKCMETKLKNEEDNHIKKYEAVVQALKERDAQLEVRCQAHTEELQKAKKRIVKLQENMEVLAAQVRCSQRTQQEAMEQKDKTIQRLHTEVETTRTGWDKYISQVSSEMVVKDTEVITLQERETKLKTELDRIKEEMEGYKQQLSAGLKRERALEQKRVQVELEWQRRCEDLKAELYLANEQLIQDLSNARDQAKAELKEKEQELQELTVLLRSVKTERDQAIQPLKLHLFVFPALKGEGEPSRVEVAESGSAGVQMMVHGTSAPFRNQPPSEVKQRRNPSTTPSNTAKTRRHGAPDRMSKIRNYNVRD